ncbi:MAG: septal ring lytic transglycosylase RlpA family protein [Candidatus Puniceispirillales bacterium]
MRNIQLIKLLYFLSTILFITSCTDVGGILEIAVKDEINNLNSTAEIPIASKKDNTITNKSIIGKKDTVVSQKITPNPIYKIGDPYEIKNIWYYPKRDLSYEETGIASWYGDKFHGKLTANGEIFNKNSISAAHKTLPMPSMVRVTNLDNGNVLNVRINDRGPYIHGRIIDLSERASELLGFKDVGIARVKVNILVEKSLWLERSAKDGQFPGSEVRDNNSMSLPKINSASRPKVSIVNTISSKNSISIDTKDTQKSFTEILASSREGNLRKTKPEETNIWVQVGAFASNNNTQNVISKISHIFDINVTSIEYKGKILQRVRLGPTQEIEIADEVLKKVFELGFNGSKIIVD